MQLSAISWPHWLRDLHGFRVLVITDADKNRSRITDDAFPCGEGQIVLRQEILMIMLDHRQNEKSTGMEVDSASLNNSMI